jgi:hypothetical protein
MVSADSMECSALSKFYKEELVKVVRATLNFLTVRIGSFLNISGCGNSDF